MKHYRLLGIGAAILFALAVAGCGGGGGSSSSSTPPTSSNVSVAISPASSTVGYGGTQQFTATVTGSTNTAVTWSVSSASSSSSSSQIGSINSSGLYTAPAATSAPPETTAQPVTVTAGNTAQNINVSVPVLNSIDSVTVTATSQADTSKSASATVTFSGLSIRGMGQCTPSTTNPNQLSCTYGSTGTEVAQGQTATLFVAGYGILPGTTYAISGADVVVIQPASSNFKLTNDGTQAVYFQITVSPSAATGPRNLIVRNQGNELASFPGGLLITQ